MPSNEDQQTQMQAEQEQTSQNIEHIKHQIVQSDKEIETIRKEQNKMRIAIPLTNGRLSQHFGHCEQFAIVDIDNDSRRIKTQELVNPPPHEPGVLPQWLGGMGVNIIIAGGMGQRAQQLSAQNQIEVVVGAPADSPENLVSAYLNKTLQTGANLCDH